MSETETTPSRARRRGVIAWAFYDWANSSYAAVITTFVFSAYYAKGVAEDPVAGQASWGYAVGLAGVLIAIAAPIAGAVADQLGRRKPWVLGFTIPLVIATALLWTIEPDPSFATRALVLIVIASVCFEMAGVFYNAMLPDLASKDYIGRVSGWSWGLGYAGGLACLVLVFVAFVNAPVPLFGLSKETAEHVRVTGPVVALWITVFALPLFLITREKPATTKPFAAAVRGALSSLADLVRKARHYGAILKFLLARMIFTDGLTTIFTFGGIYAAGTFGMEFGELVMFGIALNVTAGLGAAAFAWIDDWLGPKQTITISLLGLIFFGVALLVVDSKLLFWVFGVPLGIFVGPTQAASRSMLAHMAPDEVRNEMFGLYALSGKATAFLGPVTIGLATQAFASQRAGMATILLFLVVGLLLLWFWVPSVKRA